MLQQMRESAHLSLLEKRFFAWTFSKLHRCLTSMLAVSLQEAEMSLWTKCRSSTRCEPRIVLILARFSSLRIPSKLFVGQSTVVGTLGFILSDFCATSRKVPIRLLSFKWLEEVVLELYPKFDYYVSQ